MGLCCHSFAVVVAAAVILQADSLYLSGQGTNIMIGFNGTDRFQAVRLAALGRKQPSAEGSYQRKAVSKLVGEIRHELEMVTRYSRCRMPFQR